MFSFRNCSLKLKGHRADISTIKLGRISIGNDLIRHHNLTTKICLSHQWSSWVCKSTRPEYYCLVWGPL